MFIIIIIKTTNVQGHNINDRTVWIADRHNELDTIIPGISKRQIFI